jgi:hypothetical protein
MNFAPWVGLNVVAPPYHSIGRGSPAGDMLRNISAIAYHGIIVIGKAARRSMRSRKAVCLPADAEGSGGEFVIASMAVIE